MKTRLILVGKTASKELEKLLADYVSRVGHYLPFECVILPEMKNTRNMPRAEIQKKEGEAILRLFEPGEKVVLLDERGAEFSSVKFAAWLEAKKGANLKRLSFVIGGAFGFSAEVYARADERISLSKLTFSHQMVRVIFAEQLYRACTILKGENYHHE